MTLPASRNTTYAPGTQIKSADLNDIQDQIIAGGHGDRTMLIAGCAFHDESGGGTGAMVEGVYLGDAGTAGTIACEVPLHAGDRVKSVTVYVDQADTDPFTAYFNVLDLTASAGTPLLKTQSAGSGSVAGQRTCAITSINYTMTATGAAFIDIDVPNSSSDIVKGVVIVYDHP